MVWNPSIGCPNCGHEGRLYLQTMVPILGSTMLWYLAGYLMPKGSRMSSPSGSIWLGSSGAISVLRVMVTSVCSNDLVYITSFRVKVVPTQYPSS